MKRIILLAAIFLTATAGSAMAQASAPAGVDLERAMKHVQFDAAAQTAGASAPDPTLAFFKNVELSGFVDVYYGYNFNKPAGAAPLRNFDVNHNAFSLNLAELALEKKPTAESRGGFRVDLDYGHAAAMVNAAEPGKNTAELEHVEQAYLSYLAPGKGIQLDLGKFVTMMGNEVIETKDNWNYSRALLFTLAIPYYHMGARITIPVNDKVTLQAHIVNGWNNVFENNPGKSVGGSVTLKPTSALTIIENYMYGPEQADDSEDRRQMSDTIVSYAATKQVSLAVNYDHGQDTVSGKKVMWHGVAGYARVQPNSWFAFSPRAEWFDDPDGFTTGTAQKVKEVTLTAEVKHKDGVMMRVEYRRDFSDTPFFVKNTLAFSKNQDTFTVGFVYAFSSKTP